MNLNKILNSNEKKNDLNINYYNNNQSIIFNYKTYSYLEDYKYSYKYFIYLSVFLIHCAITLSYKLNNFKQLYKTYLIILDFNIYISAAANDYLQIKWTTDSGNSVVATYPPGLTPVHPSSPAVILTVQFVSIS